MLADIISGKVDLADVLFLLAAILFVLAAFVPLRRPEYSPVLGWLGLAAIAIGWLVL